MQKEKEDMKTSWRRWVLLDVLLIAVQFSLPAQRVLDLESCRRLALESNKSLKQAEEKVAETEALKKMAFAEFFPKATANGTYIRNQKELNLLSSDQQARLRTVGTDALSRIENIGTLTQLIAQYRPELARFLEGRLGLDDMEAYLNGVGNEVADATTLDVRNVFAGAVTVYQPVYLGGKLRALYKSASIANELSMTQLDKAREDLIVEVDEAYWRVVSVANKQRLAEQYCSLLEQLDHDVQAMLEEEVATLSDATKVKVKLNEAQMSLAKANNGLALSKMLLFQICGLDLNGGYIVAEDTALTYFAPLSSLDMNDVWSRRPEVKMLEQAGLLAETGVRVAASTLLPNIAIQGSYAVTNPNVFNGFNNSFGGALSAGVVVNIPLCHASSFYAVKAARHKSAEVQYQMQEAKEKIELQVNKLNFELDVANRKMTQAQSNLENAEANLRLATEAFANGVVSSNDLMMAQTAWLSAQTEIVETDIEIRMCRLYLDQALGRISVPDTTQNK